MTDDDIPQAPMARSETMPEYIRVKNRTLDLLDACQSRVMALYQTSLTKDLRKLAGQEETAQELNFRTAASKDCALSLMELYAYLRPKIRQLNKFPARYQLLGRMELYAWGNKPILDLATNPKYMLAAFNKMREYIEEIKLTQFEKKVLSPWQRLALGMTSRKR
jgi:hypothetical protein